MSDIGIKPIEIGLNAEKEKTQNNNAVANILEFYEKNIKICKEAHDYYVEFRDHVAEHLELNPMDSSEDFRDLLHETVIIVLTVTEIEEKVFLHWLRNKKGASLYCCLLDSVLYTVFHIDDVRTIVHINTKLTGENETRIILNKIRKVLLPKYPKYLFMLGICYGLDMKKFSIGSVFISDSISTFRINFEDDAFSDETIFQAEDEYNLSPQIDLIRRIRQYMACRVVHSIISEESNPTIAKSEMGKLLSSNCLMSSRKVKQAVINQYANKKPKPLGGEMEGAGILKSYLVEEDGFSDWIIIKSICDWGEKKNALHEDKIQNDYIKDSLQAFAMTNTCGAFEQLLPILR